MGISLPNNEAERLRVLDSLEVLDTRPEEAFDRLTSMASEMLEAPFAVLSLVDRSRQWFKSRVGIEARQAPREGSFCDRAIQSTTTLEVRDAARDERFATYPFVEGPPHIRFYAGAPLVLDGVAVGTLCVLDDKPRELKRGQRDVLTNLAAMAVDCLASRRAVMEARRARAMEQAGALEKVGHWRWCPEDDSVDWSSEVYRICGRTPEAMATSLEAMLTAIHAEDRERMRSALVRTAEGRGELDMEARVVLPNGDIRQARWLARRESTAVRTSSAVLGIVQDNTAVAELRDRLHHAEKMSSVGLLAAGVAHEINNPLSYIKTNADVLGEELERLTHDGPSARLRELEELVAEIREGTRRIHRIVQGLKTFSRPSDGRLERVDLPKVVQLAARLCANELKHRAVATTEADPRTPRVLADESQLVQVAVNLVVNSVQALRGTTFESNRIKIRCGPTSDGGAFLEVADNGMGMTPDVLQRAFDPFYTTKSRGAGTGLGLSISHGIVAAFGGRIESESEVGAGTTMRVILPQALASDTARSSAPPGIAPLSSPRVRVLIVDDEPIVGRSIARLLRDHVVQVESNPRRAIEKLRDGADYDVILCDMMMPAMSGESFQKQAAAARPELAERVLFVTGGAFSISAVEFLERHPKRVIAKPVDPRALRQAMDEVLRSGAH